jgi:hypothetical protein
VQNASGKALRHFLTRIYDMSQGGQLGFGAEASGLVLEVFMLADYFAVQRLASAAIAALVARAKAPRRQGRQGAPQAAIKLYCLAAVAGGVDELMTALRLELEGPLTEALLLPLGAAISLDVSLLRVRAILADRVRSSWAKAQLALAWLAHDLGERRALAGGLLALVNWTDLTPPRMAWAREIAHIMGLVHLESTLNELLEVEKALKARKRKREED